MKITSIEQLKEHLIGLSNGYIQPIEKYCGVCMELNWAVGIRARRVIMSLAIDWSEYSGNKHYPVPTLYDFSAEVAYDKRALWDNDEYGDSRRRLCAYLAERLNEFSSLEDLPIVED